MKILVFTLLLLSLSAIGVSKNPVRCNAKFINVENIQQHTKEIKASLVRLGFDQNIAIGLIKYNPQVALNLYREGIQTADISFPDVNGRLIQLNKKTQLKSKASLILERGLSADTLDEIMLVIPEDHLFWPLYMGQGDASFLTDNISYAERYAQGEGAVMLSFSIPGKLVYQGGEKGLGITEYVVANEMLFKRKASLEEIIQLLQRTTDYSVDEITKMYNRDDYKLKHVYDFRPFIIGIDALESERYFEEIKKFEKFQLKK